MDYELKIYLAVALVVALVLVGCALAGVGA